MKETCTQYDRQELYHDRNIMTRMMKVAMGRRELRFEVAAAKCRWKLDKRRLD